MSEKKDNKEQTYPKSQTGTQCDVDKGPSFGTRHNQSILLFFCSVIAYLTRVNISMAVVAMTNKNTTNPNFEEYDWNAKEKSYILSSFYWGYVITQIPGGQLSKKYGSKIVLFLGNFIASIIIVITPICTRYGGWQFFCGVRIIQGFCQGVLFPAINTHLSKWAPVEERNWLGGFSFSGVEFGTLLGFASSGLISSSNIGWPGIFYISGGAGFLWSIVWWFMGSNSPDEHKSITVVEKEFIKSSLNHIEINNDQSLNNKNSNFTPWTRIFTSTPFISLIIVKMAQALGFQTLLQELPTYMNSILKMDITSNAIFSAFPYLIMWLLSYVCIFIADVMIKGNYASLTVIRKTFNTIGCWIPAIALIGIAFVKSDNKPLAITLLTIAISTTTANCLGSTLNHIDLAPNYAGLLMGITNTSATIISILAPLLVGIILTDEENQSQWQIVFLIPAAVLLIGNLIFIILGKTEKQPWNDVQNKKNIRRESIFVETLPHMIE